MNNDSRAKRDEMSTTKKPPPSGEKPVTDCSSCWFRIEAQERLDAHEKRLAEGDAEMNSLATEIRNSRQSHADSSLEILRQIGNLNERVGKMLEVAAFAKSGRDIESKTPGRPELKFGAASLKGSPWLILAIVFVVAVIAVPVASMTYLEVRRIVTQSKAP